MPDYASLHSKSADVARLRASRLKMSSDAGRILKGTEQLGWLLDYWETHREAPTHDPTQAAEATTPGPAHVRPQPRRASRDRAVPGDGTH